MCAAARAGQDKADGGVLQCLVANEKATSEACARETARAVRNALSFWTPAGPVTAVCDIDVDKHCPSAKPSAERRMGEVRGAPRASHSHGVRSTRQHARNTTCPP